jgi:hypothetical protein
MDKKSRRENLLPAVKTAFEKNGIAINDEALLEKVITLVSDRCTLLTDFVQQGSFFFVSPSTVDVMRSNQNGMIRKTCSSRNSSGHTNSARSGKRMTSKGNSKNSPRQTN